MTYNQDHCLPGKYFKCSDTSVAESEAKMVQEVIPSQELPLDTSSYHSIEEPLSKSAEEGVQTLTLPLDTSDYRKLLVRKVTYRVTKK